MGIYLRKSVKAGPFRFTLSGSGVNVSAGIPGFRVGSGPRGNYVTVGARGLSYRSTTGGPPAHQPPPSALPDFRPAGIHMEDVTGATPMALAPTGSGDVVDQLNVAASRQGWGWPVTIAALLLGAVIMPFGLILWAIAAPLCWWLFLRDKARRTVVLFYDVDDAPAAWFDALVTTWGMLIDSQRLWRVVQSGAVRTTHQHKTNAGASNLVNRIAAKADLTGPRHLSTNVAIPSLAAGKASLHFLPDRVLVRDGKRYSDVSYHYLRTDGYKSRFIESPGSVPRDAQQVDQTWQYVNVKGGPDRRYANNPVLPVMLYGALDFSSAQGLDWRVQVSRADPAPAIAQTIGAVPTSG